MGQSMVKPMANMPTMPSYSEPPKPHFGEVPNYFYVEHQATLAEAARQFDIANSMYLDSPLKQRAKARFLANFLAEQAHHHGPQP